MGTKSGRRRMSCQTVDQQSTMSPLTWHGDSSQLNESSRKAARQNRKPSSKAVISSKPTSGKRSSMKSLSPTRPKSGQQQSYQTLDELSPFSSSSTTKSNTGTAGSARLSP